MQYSITKRAIVGYIFILAISMFLSGCKGCKTSKQDANQDINVEVDDQILNDINQAKKIFYSLPSPLETAMLIKTAGATYDEKLLNPISKTSDYTTNKSMALNLGIYTTDLSFASLFDQTQTSINYMQAAKKMADGLGILDAIDNKTIQRLEENVNNRDEIMNIISETFMSSSSFLKENDRTAVAAVVLVGGWVEGLYIATQLIDNNSVKNKKLTDRILEQKLSLDIVLKLLDENKESADVASLIVVMNDLKKTFDKVSIKTSKIEAVLDNKTNVTTLQSESKITASAETFKEITEKVKTIRTDFTL
jgi:hypothetical protein